MNGFAIFIIETVLMCCSIYMYWRTRLKGWALSALGFFFLSTGLLGTVIIFILEISFVHPIYHFLGLADDLQRYISVILVAVGWGLVFKKNWDRCQAKSRITSAGKEGK